MSNVICKTIISWVKMLNSGKRNAIRPIESNKVQFRKFN